MHVVTVVPAPTSTRKLTMPWNTDPHTLMRRGLGIPCAPLKDRSAPYKFARVDGELFCLYRLEPWFPHLNIYGALGEVVGREPGDLFLPTGIARTLPYVLIEAAQKHVPRDLLLQRYAEVRGNGFGSRMHA